MAGENVNVNAQNYLSSLPKPWNSTSTIRHIYYEWLKPCLNILQGIFIIIYKNTQQIIKNILKSI